MPTVTETLASMREDILARLPDPKAEGEGDNNTPTPAPEPEKENEEPAPDIDARVKALEEKCSALEDRIKAIEDAAAKTQEPAPDPEKKEEEEPAALKQLRALLKNPVVVQALSAGEDRSRASAPAPDTPPAAKDLRAQYNALDNLRDKAEFLKAHWADRASFID